MVDAMVDMAWPKRTDGETRGCSGRAFPASEVLEDEGGTGGGGPGRGSGRDRRDVTTTDKWTTGVG